MRVRKQPAEVPPVQKVSLESEADRKTVRFRIPDLTLGQPKPDQHDQPERQSVIWGRKVDG